MWESRLDAKSFRVPGISRGLRHGLRYGTRQGPQRTPTGTLLGTRLPVHSTLILYLYRMVDSRKTNHNYITVTSRPTNVSSLWMLLPDDSILIGQIDRMLLTLRSDWTQG